MGVLRLGYVHTRVTDLDEAKQHYGETMGLLPVLEEPGRVYFKGWGEWDHHSVVLEEGGVGLVKMGYKVARPEDLDPYEKRAEQFGCTVERMSTGENVEVGDGIRIVLPSDHVLELYHEMTLVGTAVGSVNPEVFPRHLKGVGAPHIDHLLIATDDVKLGDRFFREVLDFYAVERVATSLDSDADYIGTWLSTGMRPHDIALIDGPKGKLHHIAFGLRDWGRSCVRARSSRWTTCRSTSARPSTASPAARPSTSSTRPATATRSSPAVTRPSPTGPPPRGPRTSWARASSTSPVN
jgi:catechol 2,3-dioxygenase